MLNDLVNELTQRYSKEACVYRDLWAPVLLPLGARSLREIDTARVERVLEIGTGVGTLLPLLKSIYPGALVLGVDRSAGMLAVATRTVPIAVMDAMQLAVASESIDLALMNFVLFHLADPLAGLLEANRVLRPRGQLKTVTWGSDLTSPATKIWDEELDFHDAPPLDAEKSLTRHELVDSPEKMESLLQKAGFASVRTWQEPIEHMIDAEHLTRLRTSLGRSRPRYDGLDSKQRGSFLARVRQRLSSLPPDEFLARGVVVYAMGVRSEFRLPDTGC
jgi:ubiquinone/menaquinone biosynthesis C-methylase UbiE